MYVSDSSQLLYLCTVLHGITSQTKRLHILNTIALQMCPKESGPTLKHVYSYLGLGIESPLAKNTWRLHTLDTFVMLWLLFQIQPLTASRNL
jgi:hypothetical protein